MNIEDKKKKLYKVASTKNNRGALYQLLEEETLDSVIVKLEDTEKDYQQFVNLLNEVYSSFENTFAPLPSKPFFLNLLLNSEDLSFLLSKQSCGDKEISSYKNTIEKIFVFPLYQNITFLFKKYKSFFTSLKICDKMNLDNVDDLSILLDFMKKLVFANYDQYSIIYLFQPYQEMIKDMSKSKTKEEVSSLVQDTLIVHFDIMIENYKRREKFINGILHS